MKHLPLFFLILIFFPSAGFAAFSTELKPKFEAHYYTTQGLNYFDTLDSYAKNVSKPKYSENVIRWEWYPWLKLTGHKRWMMKVDVLLTLYPTRVTNRVCRFFDAQPFCRCRVWFEYLGIKKPVKIYEEFTFNDSGEMTFIEAWTDEVGLLPMDAAFDPWGEKKEVKRLSTRIPGLGTPSGFIGVSDRHLKNLATKDNDLKDLTLRLESPIYYWFKELFRSISEFFKLPSFNGVYRIKNSQKIHAVLFMPHNTHS